MLRVVHPAGKYEWRLIAVDNYRVGQEKVIDIAVEATTVHAVATMSTTLANRLSLSDNGGASYTALGTDPATGFDLGSFTVGQRKDYKLKVKIPGGTSAREEFYGLVLGEGT